MNIELQVDEAWRGRSDEFLPHPAFREAWPQHRRLKNAQLVCPLYHGDACFGLNGLYAAVNAIRLVLAKRRPIKEREAQDLIEAGLRFLECRRGLTASCTRGMPFQLWSRLVLALAHVAEARFQFPVHVEQPFRGARAITVAETFDIIETMVVRQKAAILMRSGGRFSVVSGYTPASFLLFDSGGASHILRRSCGLAGDLPSRHRLCPWSITALSSL